MHLLTTSKGPNSANVTNITHLFTRSKGPGSKHETNSMAGKPYIVRSRRTYLRFTPLGVPKYDNVAVEQTFLFVSRTCRHRTTAHLVGKGRGRGRGRARGRGRGRGRGRAFRSGTKQSEAASLRADSRETARAINREQTAGTRAEQSPPTRDRTRVLVSRESCQIVTGAVSLYPGPGTRCKQRAKGLNTRGAVPLYPGEGMCF